MSNLVAISEVAYINPTIRKVLACDGDRKVCFLPMAGVSENGYITEVEERPLRNMAKGYRYFERGDVLVAKITPCMENGKAAYADTLLHQIGFGSTEFHVLQPGPNVDGRYLFYMVWNPYFRFTGKRNMTGTAGQKRLPAGFLENFKIPLPPLPEQRRIAAILDKANAIRRKREEEIGLMEEFLRSAFLEIVGPGASDYEKWPVDTIAGLALDKKNSMRTGPFGSDLRHSEFVDKGIVVLGIDNAVKNYFDWGERRFITTEKYEKLKRYRIFPGDVIITIMGTTGRSAVVPDDIPLAITTKHLAAITLNRELTHPEFIVYAIHDHPEILHQIERAQRGAIMNGLNLTLIKELHFRVPPLPIQEHFASIVHKVRETLNKLSKANEYGAGNLFNSLVQRAFRGELATTEDELAQQVENLGSALE
jgi:type I restriction enzyme S subunit